MEEQVLSIEQMKHLQELGVDTSKASCCWCSAYDIEQFVMPIEDKDFFNSDKLTFTLQDMLEMMPESITSDNILYHFELLKLGSCYNMGYKCIIYEKNGDNNRIEYLILVLDKNSLTCAYEILCWLAENKHIGGNNANDKTSRL